MALQDEIHHVEALKFQTARVAPSWLFLLSACGSSFEFKLVCKSPGVSYLSSNSVDPNP